MGAVFDFCNHRVLKESLVSVYRIWYDKIPKTER